MFVNPEAITVVKVEVVRPARCNCRSARRARIRVPIKRDWLNQRRAVGGTDQNRRGWPSGRGAGARPPLAYVGPIQTKSNAAANTKEAFLET